MSNEVINVVGSISISRCTGPHGTTCRIMINDDIAHCRILDLEMSFEAFGNAITGLGEQPAKVTMHPTDNIGKKHEHKRETIRFTATDSMWHKTDENIAVLKEALKPYEIDGWQARIKDAFNHHLYFRSGNTVTVTIVFDRWV